MLVVDCETCQTTYLISTRNILHLANSNSGIVTIVRCPADHLTAINHHIQRTRRHAATPWLRTVQMPRRQPIDEAPEPPYYAVIFAGQRPPGADEGHDGYDEVSQRMSDLAAQQGGFINADSARGPEGAGITVSYWADETSIQAWYQQADHHIAQSRGYEEFYQQFSIRVAKVERQYGFQNTPEPR